MNEFEKMRTDPTSRRAFLQRMGSAGLGLAAVSLLHGCGGGSGGSGVLNPNPTATPGGPTPTPNPNLGFPIALPGTTLDAQVLNYALTLEILEADLYRQALNYASGKALTTPLASDPGSYSVAVASGGVNTAPAFAYIRDFAFVEAAHRDFLISTLQSINQPTVSANPKGYTFGVTPAANLKAILTALLPLEETGVRAYLGAVPYVTSLTIGQAAVAIYSTEARHSSAIHYVLGSDPGPNPEDVSGSHRVLLNGSALGYGPEGNVFEYYLTPQQVVAKIQPLIVK